jgi:hypothetical protein
VNTSHSSPAARLAAIAAELRELEARRVRLLTEQGDLLRRENETRLPLFAPAAPDVSAPGTPSPGSGSSFPLSSAEKIALFLRLFACRTDVYPRRWENPKTGRSGYSPACRNEWVRGLCEKPRVACSACPHQAFPPLDAEAVRDHLTGRHTLGTYAIRADDTCIFLAADFDGPAWRDDLTAYRRAAANLGLAVAAERSRSGEGGHAWLFFAEPVPAALARRLGTHLLARATVLHPALRLHRAHPAKTEVRIYDYHEPAHRLSAHMHRKRLATLHGLGYTSDSSAALAPRALSARP